MPYEVPAFYAADKYVTKPLFGEQKDEGPKRRWYDPARGVDFAKDIAKTTAFQFGGFMLPAAAMGAAKGSSLNFYNTMTSAKFSELERTALGRSQKYVYQNSLRLKGILQEVGHDLLDVVDKSVKFGERSSGGLAAAFLGMKDVHFNPVADMYARRHGESVLGDATKARRKDTVQNLARDIFKGDKTALNKTVSDNAKVDSLLDLIPGYKSVRQGINQGYKQYKNLGYAQKYIDKPSGNFNEVMKGIARNLRVRADAEGSYPEIVTQTLRDSVKNIQTKRTSALFEVINQYGKQTDASSIYSPFNRMLRAQVYKDRLASKLISEHGVDENTAKTFARNLSITDDVFRDKTGIVGYKPNGFPEYGKIQEFIHPSERLSVSKEKIVGENFFEELISRYNGGKYGKAAPLPTNLTGDKLKELIYNIDYSDEFMGAMDIARSKRSYIRSRRWIANFGKKSF